MATSKQSLNKKIVGSDVVLFVGAGASAAFGLAPTAGFLKVLSDRIPKMEALGDQAICFTVTARNESAGTLSKTRVFNMRPVVASQIRIVPSVLALASRFPFGDH